MSKEYADILASYFCHSINWIFHCEWSCRTTLRLVHLYADNIISDELEWGYFLIMLNDFMKLLLKGLEIYSEFQSSIGNKSSKQIIVLHKI